MRRTKLLLWAVYLLFCIAAVSCDNDREYLPFLRRYAFVTDCMHVAHVLTACCMCFSCILHLFLLMYVLCDFLIVFNVILCRPMRLCVYPVLPTLIWSARNQ